MEVKTVAFDFKESSSDVYEDVFGEITKLDVGILGNSTFFVLPDFWYATRGPDITTDRCSALCS